MENVSFRELKTLNKQGIIDLYASLNIPYPPEADLEFLRSNLRLLKLNNEKGAHNQTEDYLTPVASYEPVTFYNNQDIIVHELLRNKEIEDVYEDVEPETYAGLGLRLEQAQPQPTENIVAMAEKVPCFSPQTFGGKPSENVKSFLSHYERVATANSWDDNRKLQILPFYVTDTAHLVLENLERDLGNDLTWDIAKQQFLKTFSFTANTEILEMQLNVRIQNPGESFVQYMSDVTRLCSLIDAKMAESRVCGHILKGMNPAILQQIAMWDNTTKDKLFENVSKYETSSLLLRHRVGADVVSPPVKHVDDDLKSKIDSLTHAVNQLQLDRKLNRHRSESRDSRYRRDQSRDREINITRSRDFRNLPTSNGRGRDRSISGERSSYYRNDRHPRSRDRFSGRYDHSPSRSPTRVRFSHDYITRENRSFGPRTTQFDRRNPSPHPHRENTTRPSQPCRHCGKPHWSQDCRYRNSKN